MTEDSKSAPAGWYADPEMTDTRRYWDGAAWTEHRAPGALGAKHGDRGPLYALIGGAVAAIVGSVGPWVNALFVSVSGTTGDGRITLVLALIALGAGWWALRGGSAGAGTLGAIAGILIAVTAGYDLIQIYGTTGKILGEDVQVASPGWGIWLTLVAGVAVGVGALAMRFDRGSAATADRSG